MGRVSFVGVKPLGPLTFKPPVPFTAGVHGPAAVGTSLSYPMPSTLAGVLAGIAFNAGCPLETAPKITPGLVSPFRDQEECLEWLLGDGFLLYTGFIEAPTGVHVYTNTSELPQLHDAFREGQCRTSPIVKAVRERRIGIALDRSSKSTLEGMIYSIESLTYQPEALLLILIHAPKVPSVDEVVKIGSKTGLASIKAPHSPPATLSSAKPVDVDPENYYALLISPALLPLDKNPLGGEVKTVILSSENTRKAIAKSLLKAASIKGDGEAKLVPKGEHTLEVITPGWSLHYGKPRPPMLVVPPGTKLSIKIESPTPAIMIGDGIYITGLGCCHNLGWGTTILKVEK